MVPFLILSHPWQENSHSGGDLFQKCLLRGKKKPSMLRRKNYNGLEYAQESQNLRLPLKKDRGHFLCPTLLNLDQSPGDSEGTHRDPCKVNDAHNYGEQFGDDCIESSKSHVICRVWNWVPKVLVMFQFHSVYGSLRGNIYTGILLRQVFKDVSHHWLMGDVFRIGC